MFSAGPRRCWCFATAGRIEQHSTGVGKGARGAANPDDSCQLKTIKVVESLQCVLGKEADERIFTIPAVRFGP
jgi:hypothetical protein